MAGSEQLLLAVITIAASSTSLLIRKFQKAERELQESLRQAKHVADDRSATIKELEASIRQLRAIIRDLQKTKHDRRE